jgi:hypothetical protein
MGVADLVAGYKHILQTIYSPAEYYPRVLDSMGRVSQDMPEPPSGNWFRNLISLGRTLFTLGIQDRERRDFWKFLGLTFLRHRHRLLEAVIMAGLGYHFRRITEQLLGTKVVQAPVRGPCRRDPARPGSLSRARRGAAGPA